MTHGRDKMLFRIDKNWRKVLVTVSDCTPDDHGTIVVMTSAVHVALAPEETAKWTAPFNRWCPILRHGFYIFGRINDSLNQTKTSQL